MPKAGCRLRRKRDPEPEAVFIARVRTLLADTTLGGARGTRKTEWAKHVEVSPGRRATVPQHSEQFQPAYLPQRREQRLRGRASRMRGLRFSRPINAQRHHALCALSRSADTPAPAARFQHTCQTITSVRKSPAPSCKNPAPRRPSGPKAHARECVPALAPSSARTLPVPACHLSVVAAGGGHAGARVRAAQDPLSPAPQAGSGLGFPAPSAPPHPRQVREGPSRCRVPEGLRGPRRHGS